MVDADAKLFSKINMERFLEEKRREENLNTFNFLKGLDQRADAKNIKMLYLYREGADAQYKGL